MIADRLVRPGKTLFLALDRTHWKYGQTYQNLLCLGLLHKRVRQGIHQRLANAEEKYDQLKLATQLLVSQHN